MGADCRPTIAAAAARADDCRIICSLCLVCGQIRKEQQRYCQLSGDGIGVSPIDFLVWSKLRLTFATAFRHSPYEEESLDPNRSDESHQNGPLWRGVVAGSVRECKGPYNCQQHQHSLNDSILRPAGDGNTKKSLVVSFPIRAGGVSLLQETGAEAQKGNMVGNDWSNPSPRDKRYDLNQ